VLRSAALRVLAAEPRARLEYVELVDAETLEPTDRADRAVVMLIAAWFGDVRLIDNAVLGR
jgi:pantoate--beta-alanine ligase